MTDTLPVTQLRPAVDNPRRKVGDLAELSASIKRAGILEPLVVTPNGKGYLVVAGARRLAAAKKLRLKEVPVRIVELDEVQRQEAMLIENLQRSDLTPLEEADAFQRLTRDHKVTQRDLGERIGRSQAHISKRLALLKLPQAVHVALDSGRINLEAAVKLAPLADQPKKIEALVKRYPTAVPEYAVTQLVENVTRDKARDRRIAALGKKGITAVRSAPADGAYVGRYGALKGLDPKAHAKEPCHVVIVDQWGYESAFCTEPGRHPEGKEEQRKTAKLTAEQRRAKRHREELEATMQPRRAFIRAHIERMPTDADAFIAETLVFHITNVWGPEEDLPIAEQLLGLEVDEDSDDEAPLSTIAEQGPTEARRVALAMCLAMGEGSLESPGWQRADDQIRRHLTYLQTRGYELTKAELAELEGKAPR